MVYKRGSNKEPPSSDAETDKMEGMDERESQLEALSKKEDVAPKTEIQGENGGVKRVMEQDDVENDDNPFLESKRKKVKSEDESGIKEEDLRSAVPEQEEEEEAEAEEEDEEDDIDGEAKDENENKNHNDNVTANPNEDGEDGADADADADKNTDAEDKQREENRVTAMNGLKDIEILFAQLKDKLYETQLTKLEFELKLCENNQHPELIEYMKMVDEDFQKKTERLMNLQKYKLKCLDTQTRATRVSIHQQFMKQRQDLKAKEIVKITTDWYDINKERRTMDMQTLNLPEYYQFNKSVNAFNVENYLPALVNQRNAVFKELSVLQGLVDYKKVIPSSLNNLKGCSKSEIEADLKEIGKITKSVSKSKAKNGTATTVPAIEPATTATTTSTTAAPAPAPAPAATETEKPKPKAVPESTTDTVTVPITTTTSTIPGITTNTVEKESNVV